MLVELCHVAFYYHLEYKLCARNFEYKVLTYIWRTCIGCCDIAVKSIHHSDKCTCVFKLNYY